MANNYRFRADGFEFTIAAMMTDRITPDGRDVFEVTVSRGMDLLYTGTVNGTVDFDTESPAILRSWVNFLSADGYAHREYSYTGHLPADGWMTDEDTASWADYYSDELEFAVLELSPELAY